MFGKGLQALIGRCNSLAHGTSIASTNFIELGRVLLLCLLAPNNLGVPQERVGESSADGGACRQTASQDWETTLLTLMIL